MSDSGDSVKYKWTPESTSLLVSVWSDGQVQKQLEYATKPQLNSRWESIARYMKKKGYNVSGKQCRSRMKQVLVCYREAKRAGTRAGVEQYYDQIDTVLKNKLMEEHNINGIDTVDAMVNAKSPLKEEKTNKNMQMRHKFQEPVPSLHRTEALSPTWIFGRENEYPDSPESNETVIAQPYRMFSPTRDVAINTGEQLTRLAGRSTQCNSFPVEEPLCVNYKHNLAPHYREIPFQNAVQNVQNQIIQENMQQNQNHMYNRQNALVNNLNFQQNLQNLNQGSNIQSVNVPVQINPMRAQNPNMEQIIQHQNQLQQIINANSRAMPQEPRRAMLEQNLYKQNYGNLLTHMPPVQQTGSLSPDYSPDVSQNLNDAFCQSKNDDKTHNLNETFNRNMQTVQNPEMTVMTNNATCNDESFLEYLMMDSPTPLENDNKSKDTAVNTEIPHAPFRKKKAQKLEQLVLSAINSQNEVVNKILSAQNDMVSKFMDIDRDRQNRLENRLDDLLKVVHHSMLSKQSSESDAEIPPPPPEPTITSLAPPPRPGIAPPKLDLVPPKPCRVPCTVPSSNVELINQNTVMTRPGVVSPISSPVKKPGTIWSKLGPVSQSPFVKAQQRLGFQSVASAAVTRTQSSAERRIAREVEKDMDPRTVMFETKKLLEAEKQLEEKIENARLESALSQTLNARRRLFTQREPTAAMILTAQFLENECHAAEQFAKYYNNKMNIDDNLLAGQGEGYDRLRRLNVQSCYSEPCDTSTPAKLGIVSDNNVVAKPTIQQLAQIVMNAGRWKDAAAQNGQANVQKRQTNARPVSYNERPTTREPEIPFNNEQRSDQAYVNEWMMNKHGYPSNDQKAVCNTVNQKPNYPIGFVKPEIGNIREEESNGEVWRPMGFNVPERKPGVRFAMDEALAELQRMYIETVVKKQQEMNDSLPYVLSNANALSPDNRQMIEKYIHEMIPRKDKDTDSDNDEEFLDTTATMPAIAPRRNSITSNGTGSTETHSSKIPKLDNCVVS
ncbi:uncharacterized protein LOC108624280 [Ceratina calcarata]|uniref:Uncharacterized protein LOC108624280 n=1 Tax=Ceratina calcarata TaxID=156304 RepID=A0AAJ7IWZ4_9HYME|nr:uncharacterized protein LOC108624280 [Ceratina calcarata]